MHGTTYNNALFDKQTNLTAVTNPIFKKEIKLWYKFIVIKDTKTSYEINIS